MHQTLGGQDNPYKRPMFFDSLSRIGRARGVHIRTSTIDRRYDLLEKAEIHIEHLRWQGPLRRGCY
jgi:hypothetical protein